MHGKYHPNDVLQAKDLYIKILCRTDILYNSCHPLIKTVLLTHFFFNL